MKNKQNTIYTDAEKIHLPQLLNYIFKKILHHWESKPRYVNHWTIIC